MEVEIMKAIPRALRIKRVAVCVAGFFGVGVICGLYSAHRCRQPEGSAEHSGCFCEGVYRGGQYYVQS